MRALRRKLIMVRGTVKKCRCLRTGVHCGYARGIATSACRDQGRGSFQGKNNGGVKRRGIVSERMLSSFSLKRADCGLNSIFRLNPGRLVS